MSKHQRLDWDADQIVESRGWSQVKIKLAKSSAQQAIDYIGFSELLGVQVSFEDFIDRIPNTASFSEGAQIIYDALLSHLEKQLDRGGPTFDIDIFKMKKTEAARFIPIILELRRKEVESVVLVENASGKVDVETLSNTYYGRKLLIGFSYSKHVLDLQRTILLLERFAELGFSIELKRVHD